MKKTVEQLIREAYCNLCHGLYGGGTSADMARSKLRAVVEAIDAGHGLNDYVGVAND
jgi:hypothetical protein